MTCTSDSTVLTWKRTGTFSLVGTPTLLINGVQVLDFTGWTVAMSIKVASNYIPDRNLTIGALIANCTCAWLNKTTFSAIANSLTWPTGLAVTDILLTDPSGNNYTSNNQLIQVVTGVTGD